MSLDDTLPPILSKIDDHQPHIVHDGLLQLIQCLNDVNPTQAQRRNWSLVIYDALNKLIHEKDAQVVNQLGIAFLQILPMVEEKDPNLYADKLTKYDETLKKILFTMACSNDWGQKREWLIHLKGFVERMGHATLHWVDQINSILLDCVSGSTDLYVWVLVLKVIKSLIKNTWMKPSCREWTQIIFKILFNQGIIATTEAGNLLGMGDYNNKELEKNNYSVLDVYKDIKVCFELMNHCEDFPEIKTDLCKSLKSMEEGRDKNLYQHQFLLELDKCDVRHQIYSDS